MNKMKKNNQMNLEKKKKATNNVASMVMQICQDSGNKNGINYINFSMNYDYVVDAPVALMVMRSPDERGLPRLLGSIPGWGATTFFSLDKFSKINRRFKDEI
jgi:hypothetical protein